MKIPTLPALMFTALSCASIAQTPAETSPERTAVEANDRAFEAAYAKADSKALAEFFSDDAEYTTDEGDILKGRKSIEDSMQTAFGSNKGAKLEITVDTVKVLAPEVVLEKGSTSVTAKDGTVSGALYTAIHVKKDGKWKISQLVETPLPDMSAHDHLAELGWLVGEWEEADKTDDLTINSEFVWARGGNFLTRNVTVKRSGDAVLEGWQVIGWDPIEGKIRSWTFDSGGGFSEGRWTRDGQRWLMRETGITPDGDRTTADCTFSKLTDDRFTWESGNRTLDGEPQPSVGKIEINRVKGR